MAAPNYPKRLLKHIENHLTEALLTYMYLETFGRWVPLSLCFGSLFGKFGAAIRTRYLFGCLGGTSPKAASKVLGFFVSYEVFATLICLVESSRHGVAALLLGVSSVRFASFRNFRETPFDNNRSVLVIKYENHNLRKSLVS